MVSILYKELERKVKKFTHMKLETMQPKIKNKSELPARGLTIPDQSTWSVAVVINKYTLSLFMWLWR